VSKKFTIQPNYSHLSFKAAIQADNEWVVGEGHDVSLSKHLLDLVAQDEVVFEQLLHGVAFSRLLVTHQVHRSVRTVADQLDDVKIFFGRRFGS
jgi:hypothetical protein